MIALHRRTSSRHWGRVDLQTPADCPFHVPRSPGQAGAPCPAVGSGKARQGYADRARACPGADLQDLSRTQSLTPDATRKLRWGWVYGCAIDERFEPRGRHSGQEAEDDNSRPVANMPAGQGEPPVQGTGTEHPLGGERFHLRGDLAGICVSRLSHWRFRATYRWLAGQPNGSCRVFLDGVEQAVHKRQPGAGLVHHSDRRSQYSSTG